MRRWSECRRDNSPQCGTSVKVLHQQTILAFRDTVVTLGSGTRQAQMQTKLSLQLSLITPRIPSSDPSELRPSLPSSDSIQSENDPNRKHRARSQTTIESITTGVRLADFSIATIYIRSSGWDKHVGAHECKHPDPVRSVKG